MLQVEEDQALGRVSGQKQILNPQVPTLAHVKQLPKHAKLLKAADFNRVFDKPVRSSDRYFTVLARPNELHNARLGMAFSKKKVKLAVARNRLKRISRESFRLTQLPENKFNVDYIVLAGGQCAAATNQQLFHSLEKHWQQLNKKCAKL